MTPRKCLGCEHLRAFCTQCGQVDGLTADTTCRMYHGEEICPTFAELEDNYRKFATATRAVRPLTVNANIASLHKLMAVMGFTADQRTSMVTESVLEEFVCKAGETLAPNTVKHHIEGLHKLTSRGAVKWFKEHGMHLKPLPTIPVQATVEQWRSLSVEDRRKLRDLQFDYSRREDPRLWMMMTFAWEHGMRRSDVLRLHWSRNFVCEDGRWFLDYVANKTGNAVHWPIDEDTWRQLQVAKERMLKLREHGVEKGNYDSLFRLREHRPDEVVQSTTWNLLCKDLRRVMGWRGHKAGHNLRKDSTDTIYQTYGIDYAEAFSGDTAKILRKHYIGRKRIGTDVRSIAKL